MGMQDTSDSEYKAARELAIELLEQAFGFISATGECENKDPPEKFWEQETQAKGFTILPFGDKLSSNTACHFPNLPLGMRHVDHPNRLVPRHAPLSTMLGRESLVKCLSKKKTDVVRSTHIQLQKHAESSQCNILQANPCYLPHKGSLCCALMTVGVILKLSLLAWMRCILETHVETVSAQETDLVLRKLGWTMMDMPTKCYSKKLRWWKSLTRPPTLFRTS